MQVRRRGKSQIKFDKSAFKMKASHAKNEFLCRKSKLLQSHGGFGYALESNQIRRIIHEFTPQSFTAKICGLKNICERVAQVPNLN